MERKEPIPAIGIRDAGIAGNGQPSSEELSFMEALMAQGGMSETMLWSPTLNAQIPVYSGINSIDATANRQNELEQRDADEMEEKEEACEGQEKQEGEERHEEGKKEERHIGGEHKDEEEEEQEQKQEKERKQENQENQEQALEKKVQEEQKQKEEEEEEKEKNGEGRAGEEEDKDEIEESCEKDENEGILVDEKEMKKERENIAFDKEVVKDVVVAMVKESEDDEADEVVGEEDDMEKEEDKGGGNAEEVVGVEKIVEEVKEEVEGYKGSEEVEEKGGVVPLEKGGKEEKQQQQHRRERDRKQKGQVEGEQRTKVRVQTEHHMTERKRDTASRLQPACDTMALQWLQDSEAENPAMKTRHCCTPNLQWKPARKCRTPSTASSRQETFGTTVLTQLLLVILGLVSIASGAGLVPVSLRVEGQGRPLQGESYCLVCVVSPAQPTHNASSWYRNGTLLDHQTGRELSFSPLSKRDEGDYRCGLNLGEVQLSHSVFLHVMVFEKISLVPEVEVEEGQTVILNCSVHSDPTAFLTWRLGGKTLYTVRSNSDSLVLHNASQYHLQVVECEAYNKGLLLGIVDAYSLIRRKGTYEVVATPWLHSNVVPVLHRPFRMECLVMELPNQGVNVHLTYTWFKDDKLIEGQSDSMLTFASLTKEDQGDYTCTARNGKPLSTSPESNMLDVLVLLPPVVHIKPNTTDNVIKRASGETLTLTCEVTEALPWINEGGYRWSYLPSPGGQLRPLEGRESTLTLGPLTRKDSGQYICQAWNDALFEGLIPPGNASVTVDVMYLENITLTSSSEGDRVTLTCSVDSNPAARLSWLVEGREVRHVTANVDHYVLERAACSDNKTYTCCASNTHLPDLKIKRSSHVLVHCQEKATGSEQSSDPKSTSDPQDEAPQVDESSTSIGLIVGLSVSMSILVVVVVTIVRRTGRNYKVLHLRKNTEIVQPVLTFASFYSPHSWA